VSEFQDRPGVLLDEQDRDAGLVYLSQGLKIGLCQKGGEAQARLVEEKDFRRSSSLAV